MQLRNPNVTTILRTVLIVYSLIHTPQLLATVFTFKKLAGKGVDCDLLHRD